MENRFTANLALFMTALIWGLSFVAQRAGMDYVEPFTFNMTRSILGGLSLLPVIIWMKASHPDTRTERRKHAQHINLWRAGTACGIALFIAMSIQQYAMQYVGAGKGGFITALIYQHNCVHYMLIFRAVSLFPILERGFGYMSDSFNTLTAIGGDLG